MMGDMACNKGQSKSIVFLGTKSGHFLLYDNDLQVSWMNMVCYESIDKSLK